MSEWQATHRVSATVTFAHGDTLDGDLHLQPSTATHHRGETTLEMLNRSDPFFPMTLASGDVALAAKAQVAVVTCLGQPLVEDPERVSVAKELQLEVVVVGGGRFDGVTRTELPPLHQRALDYLNDGLGFFDLTDGDTVHFINRSMVQHVHPVD